MQLQQRYAPEHGAKRRKVPIGYAVVIALVLSGAAVLSTSRAAFTDTTDNSGNSFATGSVELVDDDAEAAAFTVTNLTPGDSVTRCIEVTYQGSIADPRRIKLYSGGYTDSGTLGEELNLRVRQGNGGTFATCAGFTSTGNVYNGTLSNFDATRTDYSNGAGNWNPSNTPVTRVFEIRLRLPNGATNAVQASSVTDLDFIWEVQS
jgi:hypothetical protein